MGAVARFVRFAVAVVVLGVAVVASSGCLPGVAKLVIECDCFPNEESPK